MTLRKMNTMVALIAAAIGAAMLWVLPYQISQESIASIADPNSPAFFPIVSALIVIICGLVLLFKTFTLDRFEDERMVLIPNPPFLLLMFFIFGCYTFLIWIMGMVTASFLMIPAMAYALGYRKLFTTLAVAVSVPLILFILFEKFLLIILPHGYLF
jgi:putative tricarboxylic transport membrane protein